MCFNKKFWWKKKFRGAQKFGEHCPPISPVFYGPGFGALPDIFTVTNCSALGDS